MMTRNARLLSKHDLCLLIELIQSSLSCASEDRLTEIINNLTCLFPYEFAICIHLQKTAALIDISHSINISYPTEWCNLYALERLDKIDPVVTESIRHGQTIQYWADTFRKYDADAFVSRARDFGLIEGYSHGVRTPNGDRKSFFSFAGRSIRRHPRTELILQYVVPHLDQAFKRIVQASRENGSRPDLRLSSREREILNWTKEGKTTWETSVILSISRNTVKYHLKNIMQKLEVVTRSQAVAVALQDGLIDID